MERSSTFGKTGWEVSPIALGTVELGVEYGLYGDGESRRPPSLDAGVALLHAAFDAGINLVDTAPAYGESERVVGAATERWPGRIYVATKVLAGLEPEATSASIAASLERLRTDRIDLLQLHNATAEDLRPGSPALAPLLEAKARGEVAFLGASVYGVEAALAAIDVGEIAAVQVALSLLDQRMVDQVMPRASEAGVALFVRSALLKGVLAGRAPQLPPHLALLARAAARAERWATPEPLPRAALRFCASSLARSCSGAVLVGVRNGEELGAAVDAGGAPPLTEERLAAAATLAVAEEELIDPRFWGVP